MLFIYVHILPTDLIWLCNIVNLYHIMYSNTWTSLSAFYTHAYVIHPPPHTYTIHHTHKHTCMYMYTHTHTCCKRAHTHTHTHTYTHTHIHTATSIFICTSQNLTLTADIDRGCISIILLDNTAISQREQTIGVVFNLLSGSATVQQNMVTIVVTDDEGENTLAM